MAFDSANLTLATYGGSKGHHKLWAYTTTDGFASIMGTAYFGTGTQLKAGDPLRLIIVDAINPALRTSGIVVDVYVASA